MINDKFQDYRSIYNTNINYFFCVLLEKIAP
jgi:hypothetical protein